MDIAHVLQIPETIRTILKSAQEMETKALNLLKHSEVKTACQRSDVIEIMKMHLATWIEDLYQHTPLSLALIQKKATSIYVAMKEELREKEAAKMNPFGATRSWFHHFQKWYGFKNVIIQGEAASADAFPAKLKRIIEKGRYCSKQVLNTDETGLYWKHVLFRTYISKKEKSVKPSKDQAALLVSGNANGDKKLKPLPFCRSENLRAVKNIAKSSLPVVCESHRKAWL
jgi:hypothetical protein